MAVIYETAQQSVSSLRFYLLARRNQVKERQLDEALSACSMTSHWNSAYEFALKKLRAIFPTIAYQQYFDILGI